jgi:hypothetical protein
MVPGHVAHGQGICWLFSQVQPDSPQYSALIVGLGWGNDGCHMRKSPHQQPEESWAIGLFLVTWWFVDATHFQADSMEPT